ncbi:2-oxoglutarate/2-oxoacid ferredoxin oxidoreductase, beta subunit (EC / 2-oxoglutarate/2-oxoacid ferredoxin oxidoreductase, gamma subunit (EC [Olavius algarvensis Delta 1 endosymbiont]|nr:2-oxoglutarate/2-oxoacid ferredoxin oxidoreductase, beta subunit (EC / 2-oxoglutarate/2-oxoacid ferredoxin oxidoreductase, gamma subunit (EC [Olavius algarvensis Delta 1 endosymbiont]
MDSLLNDSRPPVLCPGCSHERITHTLDDAFQNMDLAGDQVVMVSDIGCSGLFDTFFNTHALHGLHGRALTYAAGLKLARPELKVVVTMGDGGQGIGGAHLLAACRRNLDLTLLVLNNFNFGMTGGQYSATTPPDARVGSAFLNQLERPVDICQVAKSAGAPYVTRCSGYRKDLAAEIQRAIEFEGFSVLDIWGVCPGRYTKKNRLTPKAIDEALAQIAPLEGIVAENARREYGGHYRDLTAELRPADDPPKIDAEFQPPGSRRQEVVMLGSAGQRIITAGEILCLAGLTAGLNTTQKNEYNITVLRGPSISELILSPEEIDYTGIECPGVIVALDQEGVDRRQDLFENLADDTLILQAAGVEVPACSARIHAMDLKSLKIKKPDWALASLGVLAKLDRIITTEMLEAALKVRFKEKVLENSLEVIKKVQTG